jgi:hypothetical protein
MDFKKTNDGGSALSHRPNLGRHASNCTICRHSERQQIEQAFIDWQSPAKIAQEFRIDRSSIYRHARALNLYRRRGRNLRAALEYIIEQVSEIRPNAAAVVAATQAYAKINTRGEWVERDERTYLHDLFDRMSPEENETYAKDGTLPSWFRDAIAAAGGRVPERKNDNDD